MKKTNALRILDRNKIPYSTFEYEYQEENLSVTLIAELNGLEAKSVYKTLVLKGDKTGVLIALVPGDQQLVFKSVAKLSANKKVTTVPVKDLQSLTGYIRGGCSPIGMKKEFPVFIDERMLELPEVLVNAGQRGLLIRIDPNDLAAVTNAVIGVISTG